MNKENKTSDKPQNGNDFIADVSSSADLGNCLEKNCSEKATKDYNGHKHYVCDYHYRRLNDYFDEEYR